MTEAYLTSLRDVRDHGRSVSSIVDVRSVGSGFGTKNRPFREILNYSIVLENPRNRLVVHPGRNLNVFFAMASALWMLSGSDSLAFLLPYNPRGKEFSDDGHTLHGAHGKRLLEEHGVDQLGAVITRLREDPQSRRAVTVVFRPTDAVCPSRDIPCIVSAQYLLRDGSLHCIVNMRSQSAAMVFPYDVFAFSFLQECIAVELGVNLGRYFHNSASFHYYDEEDHFVRRLLDTPMHDCRTIPSCPIMPTSQSPFELIDIILSYETKVRETLAAGHSADSLCIPPLPSYWQDIALLMACGLSRNAGLAYPRLLEQLSPYWIWAIATISHEALATK